jgi:gamma-glutamyltranspeptidase/glutathione hydrolase
LLLCHGRTAAAQREARGQRGMVVSVSVQASDAGLAVLQAGGNAVDAAIATALALAVTHPPAGNIGGGGFMLILPPGEKPICIDYRETAPAAATTDLFANGANRHSALMVGVPGTLRGLQLAHERYGKLKWSALVEPAVKLAREGYAIDADLADSLNDMLASSRGFAELQRVFSKPDGGRWQQGDRLVQDDLGETLELIARRGPRAFYEGPIAGQIVAEMRAGGGLITLEDLARYRAVVREPIHTTYRGYDIYGPPPPSSGGIVLAQMLNVLEHFPLRDKGRDSPETLHLLVETMKRGYRDRAAFLGDADFVEIPRKLTTKEYAAEIAKTIDPQRATPSGELAGDIALVGEGESTTHFSVVDAAGMAVSNTYTLEESYGSRIVVRGGGFLLNNEMGDFNWRPGHTDREGNIGTPANVIAPGKRMLSSMTPTIVAREGRPVLITGSPGGRTIINTVLLMVLNTLEFEMDLAAATAAPRLHHQWLPDVARFERRENRPSDETLAALRKLGHTVDVAGEQGSACSIQVLPTGELHGVADPRRYDGKAAAW